MTTPLAALLRGIIHEEGPIGLDRYMELALGHPRLGYYTTRDPLGTGGDFTTAPEISQMFGEMIGLWCVAVHAGLGAPAPLRLVELGPGRGTLMADLLRAARIAPAFGAAADLHLVETSPVLRERQAATLAPGGLVPAWHASIATLPDGPMLLVANEFLDALPVRHYVRTEGGWHERLVGLDQEDRLAFGLAAEPEAGIAFAAPVGAILEIGAAGQTMLGALARQVVRFGGALLVVDYGYAAPRLGESLQALRRHATVDPLEAPGEADITAHVDFAALARAGRLAGAAVQGPVTQGDFLRSLGIEARAAALARSHPVQAPAIAAALSRLVEPAPGMGTLFKVMAVTAPGAPPLPGFRAAHPAPSTES